MPVTLYLSSLSKIKPSLFQVMIATPLLTPLFLSDGMEERDEISTVSNLGEDCDYLMEPTPPSQLTHHRPAQAAPPSTRTVSPRPGTSRIARCQMKQVSGWRGGEGRILGNTSGYHFLSNCCGTFFFWHYSNKEREIAILYLKSVSICLPRRSEDQFSFSSLWWKYQLRRIFL